MKVGQHIGALDYLLPVEYVTTFKVSQRLDRLDCSIECNAEGSLLTYIIIQ